MDDFPKAMAEQQGLQRALELYPDAVAAAAERGRRPLGELPSSASPWIAPATIFDPTLGEAER